MFFLRLKTSFDYSFVIHNILLILWGFAKDAVLIWKKILSVFSMVDVEIQTKFLRICFHVI